MSTLSLWSGHSKCRRYPIVMFLSRDLFPLTMEFKKQKRKFLPLLIFKTLNIRRQYSICLTSMRWVFHQGALIPGKRLLERLRKVKQCPANDDIVVESYKIAHLQKKRMWLHHAPSVTPLKTSGGIYPT